MRVMKLVMAWQIGALVLSQFTLYFICLCPDASFGQNVTCCWNEVASTDHNMTIECHTEPQHYLQKCGQCQLYLNGTGFKRQAVLNQCSHSFANFATFTKPQAMHSINCMLICPGQKPGTCKLTEAYPPPTCLIPVNTTEGTDNYEQNIFCHWTRSFYPSVPTNFTLHWGEITESNHLSTEVGDTDNGIIPRADFVRNADIKVWVSAVSTLGKMESESQVFNTGNIHEPLPPVFKDHILDPLDIIWTMQDIVEGGSSPEWLCEVQYKNEYDMKWTEAEDFHGTNFVLFYPVPFTTYTFRVRCGALGERLIMSDWNLYIVKIPAAAPDGKLEVWSDCESNSEEPSCTILWKEMPKIQARGLISSYVLELELNNGSNKHEVYTPAGTCTTHGMLSGGTGSMNSVSRTGQSNLTCYQCCVNSSQFTVPIWMVKGIKVMAKSSEGMSSPAHVAFPRTGRQITGVVLTVTGDRQFLNVSWSVPSQFTVQSVQGYVVQSKPIGQLPEVSLNWVRVHRNLTFATLRGAFQNYTAYNVSLFAVFMNFSQLLQSAVVFSVEGVPPKITDFGVTNISSVSVTLTWKPIPLNKSRGVILKYMVGLGNETVLNVSSDMNSVLLSELNPDQRYDVWISAVTVAGEGERTVTRFTTTANDKTVLIAVLIMLAFVMILFIVLIFWCNIWPHFRAKLKIPDPINSSLFHQKNNQNWQSSLVPSSLLEHPLTISAVNVVMGPDNTIDPGSDHELIVELPEVDQQKTWPEENGEDRGGALQESGGLERVNSMLLHKTKDYRQVIDSSDEEANREDEDEDEEWFEQTSTSDYEKHFLPCVQDA